VNSAYHRRVAFPSELGNSTSRQLQSTSPALIVPVGSVEQHGPHLPLDTDTRIATAVGSAVAERLADQNESKWTLAPAIGYGASGEHEGFPGTVSIGHEALFGLLVELGRSATRWARGVVFVNGHGGNVVTLTEAVALLRHEGRAVAWTSTTLPVSDAHAGDTETSLLRHLAPWSVRVDLMAVGATEPVGVLLPRLREQGVIGVSPNGVLGDPTTSSAEKGRELLGRLVGNLVDELVALDVADDGRLSGSSRESMDAP
jgi:mycofactocin precursor peptide peptidase